ESDRETAGVRNADEAYELKVNDPAMRPYLDLEQIVDLAEGLNVDAVHPGYGFLAQNARFARELESRGIKLIAPRVDGKFNLSNKYLVKEAAVRAGLPVIKGSTVFSDRELLETAVQTTGFPLVMKAAHGYGGIGMRIIKDSRRLESAFDNVQSTSRKFLMNSPEVFLEEYLPGARHIEFPVLRDRGGRTLVFPELECPLQRRFQKLLIETPAPHLDPTMRSRLQSEVRVLCDRLGVFGFASVEFLIKDGRPYFLEINGYIQPSHTATTLLTGVDLLKEQIRLLSGEPLNVEGEHVSQDRHVIGTYIFAEDPLENFAPSPGVVDRLYLPFGEEVFMQTSIFSGATISPFYDPMVAKLLVRGRTRDEAILKMGITLDEFFVEGVKTNIPLMRGVLNASAFRDGTLTAEFIANPANRRNLVDSLKSSKDFEIAALVAALALHRDGDTLKRMEVLVAEHGSTSVLGAATRWIKPRKNRRRL
ncbi:MAG TPA: biotin carboxylase N-terminal domain-containing protein, partial [Oceanipulchritudo sp.]|nr:biotin carboxylase N-terminal domain-containing protein [Oceanipulchritudo sp.]